MHLIYRTQRAPERRVFYIDVGNMPTWLCSLLKELKQKYIKDVFPSTGGSNKCY